MAFPTLFLWNGNTIVECYFCLECKDLLFAKTLGSLLPHCVAVLLYGVRLRVLVYRQGWIADSSIQEATSASGRSVVCPPNSVFCAVPFPVRVPRGTFQLAH
jgi:hypothetical protein